MKFLGFLQADVKKKFEEKIQGDPRRFLTRTATTYKRRSAKFFSWDLLLKFFYFLQADIGKKVVDKIQGCISGAV